MNAFMKRVVSFVLCFVLVAGCLPASALAAENRETITSETTEVTEESTQETSEETEEASETEETTEAPSEETTESSTEETETTTEETETITEETESEVIAVTGIALDQTALEVGVGAEPVTLTATVLPEDAADQTVTWTSSEPGVASVDENGIVTFGYMGEAVITATAGEFSAECAVTVGEGEAVSYADDSVVVIASSDYQPKSGYTAPATTTKNILAAISEKYPTANGFLFGGDYSNTTLNATTDSANGKKELKNIIDEVYPDMEDYAQIYVQGNHDADSLVNDGTLSSSGAHDTDAYGVYVLNEKDYPWGYDASNYESTCKATAEALDSYLDEKVEDGYAKPVFVISHVPLHFTSRITSTYDGKYAKYLYDVLDEAGAAGLNIIFLFGHNHSSGYDAYLGNGSIYLAKGKSITVANIGSSSVNDTFTDTLDFTYMNAGYVGYVGGSACTHLTMTTFEITGDEVIVKRYDTNGEHNCDGTAGVLKAAGVTSSGNPAADTSVVASGATIELTTPTVEEKVTKTDNNVTVVAPGLTGLSVTKTQGTADNMHDAEIYSAYASYDIIPEGYEQGKKATVTITLDEAGGFDSSREVIVIDVEKGTATATSIVNGNEVIFTTNHFTPYAVAQKAIGSGYTYELVTEIVAGESYVIVGNDHPVALMDDGSLGSQEVTVSSDGNTLTSETELTLWTISGTDNGTIISNKGSQLGYNNSAWGLVSGGTVEFDITANAGNFKVQMQRGYNNYNFYYDGTDWTDKSTSDHYVRLYQLSSGSSGGGSNVTPSGGDWVTISSGVGGTIYALDTDGVSTGENYLIVSAGTDGTAQALRNNNGTVASAEVSISNGQIVANETDIVWTYTTSKYLSNGEHSFYLSNNNKTGFLSASDQRAVAISAINMSEGSYSVKRDGFTYSYYLNYSEDDGWTNTGSNGSAQAIYFYVESGTEAAGDAEYAKMVEEDGTTDFTFTVSRGTSADNALKAVQVGINVLTSVNADGSDSTTLLDTNENITWAMDSSYGDGTTAGEYAVKIYYKEKLLGTVKIIVPEVTINDITVSPTSGTVTVGASEAALVGATITVDVADGEGEDFTVPVTVGMLSGDFTTATAGIYEGLTVSYNGFTKTGFTLTVKEKVVNSYPSYPNEGAVKVDKTAHGVDFQKTGVARVELSASGVPMNQGVDVVIVLDTSSSMTRSITVDDETVHRIDLLRPAVDNLIQQLQTKREDGSDPDIDIAIIGFNGNTIKKAKENYIGESINDATNLSQVGSFGSTTAGLLTDKTGDGWVDIMSLSTDWATRGVTYKSDGTENNQGNIPTGSGTNYDFGLEKAYDLLEQKQRDNGDNTRKQFVLFLSDGAPSQYNGVWSNDGVSDYADWLLGNYESPDEDTYLAIPDTVTTNKDFYTGYTGGKGQLHRAAEAIKGNTNDAFKIATYDSDGIGSLRKVSGLGATIYSIGLLLKDVTSGSSDTITRTAKQQEIVLETIASSSDLFTSIKTVAGLGDTFTKFGEAVLFAAENAVFEDQLGARFNIQLADTTTRLVDGAAFTLDPAPTMEVREYTIWTRAELEDANGNLSEENAKKVGTRKTDENGDYIYNTLESVSFKDAGTKAYTDGDTDNNIMIDGVIYANTFWFNTTTAAVMIDADDDATTGTDGKEFELKPETFLWKVGTIKSKEIALSYYVYLDDSLEGEASAGSYETNTYAILFYDNYLGIPCRKDTISPQMAWLSANVSYAYYLVNSDGQPVNANGEVVTFANREVIVNPTVYHEVPLNSEQKVNNLEIASTGILDEGNYALFDYAAKYNVTVLSDGGGNWTITKGTKTDDEGNTIELPKTTYVTGFSDTVAFSNDLTMSEEHDYTHTTVWFAVVWEPDALDDTVVIDYGLPVDVHVLTNDFFGDFGTLVGVGYGEVTDDGDIKTNEVPTSETPVAGAFGNAQVIVPDTGANESNSVIRYTMNKSNGMQMNAPEVFTYSVEYTNTKLHTNNGFYYGKLTVIPATTIYYEDEFVDLSCYTWDDEANNGNGGWVFEGNTGWDPVTDDTYVDGKVITQDEDRPDDINFAFDTVIDANNIYGYDSAYNECSKYSLGSAVKTTVNYDRKSIAAFDFYGTGFDVISLTSNETGTIMVNVYPYNGDTVGSAVRNLIVDTFYGYVFESKDMDADGTVAEGEGEWVVSTNSPAALYQVPVMEVAGLTYGKYRAEIVVSYDEGFDHVNPGNYNGGEYDFYLDAIRIYDPANDGAGNEVIKDAYVADSEGWPYYEELRNNIIEAAALEGTDELPGIVFIDSADKVVSVADYTNVGPNNELYLAKGQAIVFQLDLSSYVDSAGKSIVDAVHLGIKSATGANVSYKIFDGKAVTDTDSFDELSANTIKTATSMYYDITDLKDKAIAIYNSGSGMLSVTDIKVTFTQDPGIVENLFYSDAAFTKTFVNNMNTPATDEADKLEITSPTSNSKFTVGTRITVKVTTSIDVAAISVDGKTVTTYSVNRNGERVWTANVSASSEGQKTIEVNAYDMNGNMSGNATVTVTVQSVATTVTNTIRDIVNKLNTWFMWW